MTHNFCIMVSAILRKRAKCNAQHSIGYSDMTQKSDIYFDVFKTDISFPFIPVSICEASTKYTMEILLSLHCIPKNYSNRVLTEL